MPAMTRLAHQRRRQVTNLNKEPHYIALLAGPPDPKRPRALTPAERIARSRAKKSAEQKESEKMRDQNRKRK